jgi:Mg2+ and Co2+ transporter CorA
LGKGNPKKGDNYTKLIIFGFSFAGTLLSTNPAWKMPFWQKMLIIIYNNNNGTSYPNKSKERNRLRQIQKQETLMSGSSFVHISRAGKLVRMPSPASALEAAKKGGTPWLHYSQPTKEDLSELVDLLGLHPLSIEDCLDDNQIPKIEDYPKHSFILFNAFSYANKILWMIALQKPFFNTQILQVEA